MKQCSKCKKTKPLIEFTKNYKSGGYRKICLVCHRIESKISRDRTRGRMRLWLDSLKDGPCTDCEIKYPPYVMEWDHLSNKSFDISNAIWTGLGSKQKILDEIAKCELVCSNCHRIRTHQRRNHA